MERSILKLPLSKLCTVPFALQNRAFSRGGKGAEKRGGRGVASKGGKKEKGRVKTGQLLSLLVGRIALLLVVQITTRRLSRFPRLSSGVSKKSCSCVVLQKPWPATESKTQKSRNAEESAKQGGDSYLASFLPICLLLFKSVCFYVLYQPRRSQVSEGCFWFLLLALFRSPSAKSTLPASGSWCGPLFRGNLDRYTKRPLQDSATIFPLPGWENLRFAAQITGFPANVSNPPGGKSIDVSGGKCHLLYFVVVPESLIFLEHGDGVSRMGGSEKLMLRRSLCLFCPLCSSGCALDVLVSVIKGNFT